MNKEILKNMLTGFGIAIGFILVVLLRVIDMDKGDIYYYVRQLPKTEQYDIVQVKLRTVTDKYYVGVFTDGSRQTVLFSDNDLDNLAFYNFGDAKERMEELKKLDGKQV